jgi:hypothetical protein
VKHRATSWESTSEVYVDILFSGVLISVAFLKPGLPVC